MHPIASGATIGIIGGGQLGKMLAQSAKEQGYRVVVLDPAADCVANGVCDAQVVAAYDDVAALLELAKQVDVLTFEFENIDAHALQQAMAYTSVPQGVDLLLHTQDRLAEKALLTRSRVPIVAYCAVHTLVELHEATAQLGYPCVLKTTRFGYDGKGQVVLRGPEHLETAGHLLDGGTACVLEQWLPFDCELSVMVVRNPQGSIKVFPVAQNQHVHNILHTSVVPALVAPHVQQEAQQMAQRIAEQVQLVGVLGVELFYSAEKGLFVNELAPRPHNSGHYSIEACTFSQFDCHIAAICNWPLPQIELLSPVIMVNILGQHVPQLTALRQQQPSWHYHLYGKTEARDNRKMGHITIMTHNTQGVLEAIASTQIWNGGTVC